MKYLIVPTQNFSGGMKGQETVDYADLPSAVKWFIEKHNKNVHVVLDESSWIKTTQAVAEKKKSQRTRLIKVLTKYTAKRMILTGTLKSKSPMNVIDQYQFLDESYFPEGMFSFAEKYCILMNLRTARGRRVIISETEYLKVRKRMANAWRIGGAAQLELARLRIMNEYGISDTKLDHIMAHRKYTPFINQRELMMRVKHCTISLQRKDVFDISYDKYIYEPIKQPVELPKSTKNIANQLIELGFLDDFVLGKAAALELMIRLQDICNGFEPVKTVDEDGKATVTYKQLKENPKLDALEERLESIDTKENQVVIWCARTNAFDSICERLKSMDLSYVMYSGAEDDEAKKLAEDQFEAGEARIFLANQGSAAFGLNCLRNCNYVIEYCNDASVEKHHQSQHRVLRGQSMSPKFAYQIYVKGSMEERIITALNVGKELLSSAITKDLFWFD